MMRQMIQSGPCRTDRKSAERRGHGVEAKPEIGL